MERTNSVKTDATRHGLGWRGWLSIAPVLALLGFGTYLVFQENRLARQDALESLNAAGANLIQFLEDNTSLAQWIQDPKIYNDLFRYFLADETYNILVAPNGECLTLFSPDHPPIPSPSPLPWHRLSESEILHWHEANQATDPVQRLRSVETFLAGQPPEPFAALMRLTKINLLLDTDRVGAGLAELQQLRKSLPEEARSEAGLPLSVLIDFQELRAINALVATGKDPEDAFSRFYSRRLTQPNAWTRQMLTQHLPTFDATSNCQLLTKKLLKELDRRDEARAIHASLPKREWQRMSNETITTPRWIDHQSKPLLVYHLMTKGRDHEFIAATADSLRSDFRQVIDQWHRKTPNASKFEVSVTLAGERILPSKPSQYIDDTKPALSDPLQAAQNSETFPWLQASVALADQNAFFAQARSRTRSLLLLITLASVSGLVGWWAQRAAYQRQVALGQMKSNFVASVSHELRAPIASIRLMGENLQANHNATPQQRNDYFKWIGLECGRLAVLVENVLQFARLETRKTEFTFEPVDIGKLFTETLRLMDPIATNAGVYLEIASTSFDLTELSSPLEGNWDGQAIHQALVNLVDNAIKHTDKEGTVSTRLEWLPDKESIRFSVIDPGPGIPLDDRERIFAPFERLGCEGTRRTKGVGIGLSLVKHTANAHGGTVWVQDAEGGGSCFVLQLPLQQYRS